MDRKGNADISIVIPTKNAGPLFREVLDGVFSQPSEYEVLVVDSGSTDETLDIAADYPLDVIEIPPEEFDHGGTRNLGAERTDGEFIVYLTQDASPTDGWLKNLVAPLREDGTIAGAYSRQVPREEATPMKRHFYAQFYPDASETRSIAEGDRLTADDVFFSNVSSVVRRSVWEDHPFPEDCLMSEDQHWARAVLREGHAIRYESDSVVRHSHSEGVVDIFRRYFDSGASLEFPDVEDRTLADMVRYQASELRYLIATGNAHWIPYALVYSGAKFLGYQLGQFEASLPEGVRRSFSDTLSTKYG